MKREDRVNEAIKQSRPSFSMAETKTNCQTEGKGSKRREFSAFLLKRKLKLETLQLLCLV